MTLMRIHLLAIVLAVLPSAAAAEKHPWDGAARAAWVAASAKRVYRLEGAVNVAALADACDGRCPEAAYVSATPAPADHEVHGIGVYEAASEASTSLPAPNEKHPKPIDVVVRRTDKPVVLVLTSYDPVTWRIHLAAGASLQAVRHSRTGTVEMPPGLPVAQTVAALGQRYSVFSGGDEFEVVDAERNVRSVERAIGDSVDTFQEAYKGSSFIVPFCHDLGVVREVVAKVRELQAAQNTAPPASFDLTSRNAFVRFDDPPGSGNRRTLANFGRHELVAATYADVDRKYYGITDHDFMVLDAATGATTKLEPPPGYPDPSWLRGLAYDAKAKRLVIASESPYFLTYDPLSLEWRLFPTDYKTRPSLLGGAVVYDRNAGVLLGFAFSYTESELALVALDSQLRPTHRTKLSDANAIRFGPLTKLQLAVAGRSVVVCTRPDFGDEGKATCWLVEVASGRVSKLALPRSDHTERRDVHD